MKKEIKQTAREVLGQFLTGIYNEKKLSLDNMKLLTGLQGFQIKDVLSGSTNYTVDNLLSVIQALDLYIFFSEKEGKHLNFDHMQEKMEKDDPKIS